MTSGRPHGSLQGAGPASEAAMAAAGGFGSRRCLFTERAVAFWPPRAPAAVRYHGRTVLPMHQMAKTGMFLRVTGKRVRAPLLGTAP